MRRLGRRSPRSIDFDALSDEDYVVSAYHYLFGVQPDDQGLRTHTEHLRNGTRDRQTMVAEMRGLDDWWLQRILDPLISIHLSRKLWVQQLPKAARILDLGGTDQSSADGALVRMGYPYAFERLVVIDLPAADRHELYASTHGVGTVPTRLGPVDYHERSMLDLSVFEDESFDLIVSGQSIEHITEKEGDVVLREVHRVLRPGGHLCLDTPNGEACRLQLGGPGVINPDHKIEYSHGALSAKLASAGFVIERAQGLNHLPTTFETGTFRFDELARFIGVFDDIERCYVLAYRCAKPAGASGFR